MEPTIPGVYLNATNSGVTTGLFQEVLLPASLPKETMAVRIQIHSGSATDLTSYMSAPPGFHYSKSGDEAGKDFAQHIGEFAFDINGVAGASLGYVRATADQYLIIEVLS